MKRKTPFQILKAELPLPKQITIDDADGTRIGENGVYLSDIIAIMEQYAEQEVKFISSNLPVKSSIYGGWEIDALIAKLKIEKTRGFNKVVITKDGYLSVE